RSDRAVDEALKPGEVDDLVEVPANVCAGETVDGAGQVDVVAAAEVGLEAGAELEERAHAAADLDPPAGRLDDSGEQAQQRRLAGAVAADEPDRMSGLDPKGDVVEGDHLACLRT